MKNRLGLWFLASTMWVMVGCSSSSSMKEEESVKEEEKVEASVQRIIETAMTANELGGYSITYHAGFYLNQDAEMVYDKIKAQTKIITDELNKVGNKIWIYFGKFVKNICFIKTSNYTEYLYL